VRTSIIASLELALQSEVTGKQYEQETRIPTRVISGNSLRKLLVDEIASVSKDFRSPIASERHTSERLENKP
jgi:hypothetical protein